MISPVIFHFLKPKTEAQIYLARALPPATPSSRHSRVATPPSVHAIETLEHGAPFEPDEHLATLVLRHVGEVRDRLALECVSRVWRAVEGCL